MIFQPYFLGCLSHASYLIADEVTRGAVVVDPQRDVDAYLAFAAERGLEIRHVVLTHFHADFVAGHIELAAATGATIHLGARARAEFAFRPLADGDRIRVGAVEIVALETPGHTPEGITLLVYDTAVDARVPRLALTGDTLFVGDVGRPDLMASAGVTAEALAVSLYHSVHDKLARLPDSVEVWPAHGAGSMCGKNLSNERASTIGNERRANWAFLTTSKEEFVRAATSDLPLQPAYFAYDADLNRRARPTLREVLAGNVRPAGLDRVLGGLRAGDTVLDVREADDFARGHLAGATNIGLSGKFATWAGIVLDRAKPIWLVAPEGKELEAATRLGRIGFDFVRGFLDGGAAAFAGHGHATRTFGRVRAETLADDLASPAPPHVLDVRAEGEWKAGHVEGAQWVPLPELERRVHEVPRDRRVVVQCGGGYRSSIAASLLLRHGFTRIEDQIGGWSAWAQRRSPAC